MAVDLVGVALGAEGDEHRQRAEVINVVEHRADAQRAEVGDDHGAVEGAGLDQRIGDQAEVIHHTQDGDGKAEKKARHPGQGVGHLFGVVVLFAGLDLLDLLVHLAVDVKDRVGGLKVDLDGGLGRVDGEGALDRHDHGDIVVGIDAAAGNKAVDAGQHRDAANIGRNEEMQHADALIAFHAQSAQRTVHPCDLEALIIEDVGVVSGGHDVGNKLGKGRQRTQQAAVSSVARAASCLAHGNAS